MVFFKMLPPQKLLLLVIALGCFETNDAFAKPKGCGPSDPTGRNRVADLCLTYPTHGLKPYGNSFTDSFVHQGFYGPKISPLKPGIDLKPRDRHGFFTGVKAKNGVSIIHSSSGKTWKGTATPQKIRLR